MQTNAEDTQGNRPVGRRFSGKWLWGLAPVLLLLGAFFVLALRRAWLSDDAYITFRTVDNLVHGYRLTWNVTERVQAYTHPLWMFLVSLFYFFTHEIYHTAIAVSLGLSLAAVALLAVGTRSRRAAAVAVFLLCLSNAYVDYSTSGLENPLTHLLLVAFLLLYFGQPSSPGKLFRLSLVASLAAVNRLDTFLLYAPALLVEWLRTPDKKKALLLAAVGQAPLVLWEAFSVFYYGFPFPNTAYAKLNNGIAALELARQGGYYFLNSLQRDPLTLAAIAVGCVAALAGRPRRGWPLALGILLYLAYVLKIGGDFMSGRFFTAPLLVAVALIGQLDFRRLRPPALALVFVAALGLGLAAPVPVFRLIDEQVAKVDAHGIADERMWYFQDMALANAAGKEMPTILGRYGGEKARADSQQDFQVVVLKNTGVYGYYAGPQVFIIDYLALSDPLLARLPAIYTVNWRIGHFSRVVPEGYISTVYANADLLKDPGLAAYYDQLALITRGPLFSKERWVAIWKMNTGQYDHLIPNDPYRYPEMVSKTLAQVAPDAAKIVQAEFQDSGVQIELPGLTYDRRLRVALDGDSDFEILYLNGETQVAAQSVSATSSTELLSVTEWNPPESAVRAGYDRIHILPRSGDDPYHLGFLELEGE